MMIRKILTGILIVVLLVAPVACDTQVRTTETTATGKIIVSGVSTAALNKKSFAVIFPIVHPFFEPIGLDVERYAKENQWDIITRAPNASDAQIQISIMENLIAARVDGIAIGPTDPSALVPSINKAIDAGIKVICFETDAPASRRQAYIGTDNYKAGRHMGEVIRKNLFGKGKILILTGLSAQMSLNERVRGIKEFLIEKSPGIQIIDMLPSEGDPEKAVSAIETMITAHPDFNAIIGIDATAGPASIAVWKAKGWRENDDRLIITFDDMPENLQGMRDGFIKSIVSQRQNSWGKGALDMLDRLVEGNKVEPYLDTGSIEITMDNINTYLSEPSYVETK